MERITSVRITSVRFPAKPETIRGEKDSSIALLQQLLEKYPVEHDVFNRENKRFETQPVKSGDLELAHFAHPDLPFSVICVGYPGKIGDGEVEESLHIPGSKITTLTVSGQDPVNIKFSSHIYRDELERMTITKSVFNLEGREVTMKSEYFRNCAIPIIRSGEIKKSAFREDRIDALIVFIDGMALKIKTGEEIKRAGVLFL